MSTSVDVVKHHSKRPTEPYAANKLHDSIVAVCREVRTTEGAAQSAADSVCHAVDRWLQERPEVTSEDIRRVAAKTLTEHNPDAAYLYTQHKHII